MCTLTVLPTGGTGYRLAFNRDESRSRPRALPPGIVRLGDRWALRPVDPLGGGTWIGVNDAGLSAALLNLYDTPGAQGRIRPEHASRGEIVAGMLASEDLGDATRRAAALDPGRYPPFRVLICHGGSTLDMRSDGSRLLVDDPLSLSRPLMRTSSGLGDDRVETPRRELFESMLRESATPVAQDRYHRHSWPDDPHRSVCMRRPEAATVSLSILEVDPAEGQALFVYHPGPPDENRARDEARLELSPGAAPRRTVA